MVGDLLQRIYDHNRIEVFLTSTTLNVLYALVNIVVFGIVLIVYNISIFAVFLIGTGISAAWILFLLKKRREIDYKRFSEMSQNQSTLIQLITGMPEIKLNSCEKQKRWEWEQIQARLFRLSLKGLGIDQFQQAGTLFVNELKNIIISFLAAKSVIDGDMTLGMMVSVQYIIGQLNGPVGQLIDLFRSTQDARISLERMGEIHNSSDEEDAQQTKVALLPDDRSIELQRSAFGTPDRPQRSLKNSPFKSRGKSHSHSGSERKRQNHLA